MRQTVWFTLAGAAMLFAVSCSKPEEKEVTAPVPVQVTAASTGSIQRIIGADGILRAIDQSAIVPKISAPVTKFYVNRGDHVKRGQLLAELESRDLAAAVAEAKGAYEQAQAAARNVSAGTVPQDVVKAQQDVQAAKEAADAAQKVLESRRALQKEGALAQRLVDEAGVSYAQARSQYETAKKHLEAVQSVSRIEDVKGAEAQVTAAKGKLDAAEAQLSYAQIRSPISGVVADRPLYPGEMANAGSPMLTVMDLSSVIARVNVPIAQAGYVKVGQRGTIQATDGTGRAQGTVTVVSPAVDPNNTTVEVWVQAANPGEKLRAGATVHITIQGDTLANALLVPLSALLPSSDGGVALMVVDNDSVAHEHPVETGIRTPEQVQILKGIAAGDKVVVQGGVGLEDGARVQLGQAGAEKTAEHE
jgi:HlyD family secretion protein